MAVRSAQFPQAFGKYQLVARIAHGGMSEIYRAYLGGSAGFEKVVVVKRLLPHLLHDRESVELFVHEAKLSAQIHHRNVVQVYALEQLPSGEYYIVMEHVEGTDLARVLNRAARKGVRIPPWFSAHVMSEVLDGLSFVHDLTDDTGRSRNVVHRDVSPSNIFISTIGNAKLGDFGVAKDLKRDNLTRPGSGARGKTPYMSPEQIRGEAVDGRSDIFSAAIVLWEALAQRRLYSGASELKAMNEICFGASEPPSNVQPDVTPDLDACVLRALERDAARRTQTAREFHKQLSEAVSSLRPGVRHADVRAFLEELFAAPDLPAIPDDEDNFACDLGFGEPATDIDGNAVPAELAELVEVLEVAAAPLEQVLDAIEASVDVALQEEHPPKEQAAEAETVVMPLPQATPRVDPTVIADGEIVDPEVAHEETVIDETKLDEVEIVEVLGPVVSGKGEDWREALHLADPYDGPHPFWITDRKGAVVGPLAYADALYILRWEATRSRAAELKIAAAPDRWIDVARFARLTGQELLLDAHANRELELPKTELAGALVQTSVTALFARLARENATGRLYVLLPLAPYPRREILISEGRPVFVYANTPALQLPEQLVARKMSGEEQLPELIHGALTTETPLDAIAAERNGVTTNHLRGMLMKDRAIDLFRWKIGRFAFEPATEAIEAPSFAPSLMALLPEMVYRGKTADDIRLMLAPKLEEKYVRSDRFADDVSLLKLTEIQSEAIRCFGGGRRLRTSLDKGPRDDRFKMAMAYVLLETELLVKRR